MILELILGTLIINGGVYHCETDTSVLQIVGATHVAADDAPKYTVNIRCHKNIRYLIREASNAAG